ncbi:Ig-like domain-containing protein [Telluria mixta]|uniref:Ig-like domain-containing protein n=1 Tax=Telluria mixta TaxID=34071 RepID=UPI00247908C0|nr:Ig-like domain-containing protein [Telluria mixta]WEM94593.1 Ig-like domain-containing protein [Telluria mixta]
MAGSATSVDYTVTFSESVSGVDASDFALTATGTASGAIAAVSGSGTTYTITVDSLAGDGTLRLDLNASGTGIQNGSSVAIASGYTAGAAYTLDHTAPNAPSTPDMSSASDGGSSSSDDITATATPVVTGTAEAGSTVTLYDTNGTTVLGTTTATGGNWSITAGTLAEGSHTLTAKAADAAGNVSNASGALAVTIDTTAPASVALSASTVATSSAGSGAAVGTLSATDATVVTYALTTGNGTNDADNGQFAVSGNALAVGGSALTAGTYHVYLSATDAAGNVSYLAQNITVVDAPTVSSIVRAGGAGAGAAGSATSVDYTVTFSESVTGVDASDFALTATGTASGTIASVSGSGTTYTVTVGSLAGDGTLRLDVNASGTGILNGSSIAIGGGYTSGATYALDHTAPNAPSTPDLNGGSDSGSSNSDDITSSVTPVITGTAEAGSTVTLYDTNGTTVLGTTTATGGNWSITAGTLAEGSHTLTAKAADAAGNVSNASGALAVTIDTTAPASVALSATSLVTANAGSGASVGTLSATDATAVTYALATGNGTNDANNAQFALSGNTVTVGGSALTAGTYHVYLSATDAAGNVSYLAENITVQDAPTVSSIVRVGGADAGAATSVDYTVTFSESVTGVDAGDFALTATGTAAGHISAVSGSGTTYTVTVGSLTGDGTLRLDLNASGTGIQNGSSIAIGGGYTSGATYALDHTAPNAPSSPDLSGGSDSGSSNSDDITSSVTPVITGTAEAGSTVTLYDTNGTTVLGTAGATGGVWSITANTLVDGNHTLTAKATDAAGNVSNASGALAVTIDTTAPASVALSASSLVTANAGSGATVGTLSATDATAVTYALASGSNDADNAKFALSGNTLTIGGSALAAGTYHVYLSATDAAGNVSHIAQNITVQDAPSVTSIVRVGGADAGAATSVDYTVTFSDSVTGVDAGDFALTATGTAGGHIAAVSGSGTTYTVTVDSLAGDGTLRLDLNASGTGIQNGSSIAIGGGYTSGATYTLDHTAPNAPSTPDLNGGSDSGSSNSDDITSSVTPVITGTAEAGCTVTLYDTNGTTVLGTTTATGGNWSITAGTLAEGNHALTAKATDAAGNVSNASSPLAVTIDTTAPANVALSASSLVTANAASGAMVGTLSATDATAVTYALASGSNDADNAKFALSGNTLAVGGSALTAGTYHVHLSATDAAGNVSYLAQNITVQDAPTVSSIVRVGGTNAGAATSVDYTVTFSDSVTGVDAGDFTLTATGTAAGHIAAVNGSGTTYTVTVDSLAGDGTLRLDLNASGTGIQNGGSIAIGGGYTGGATYTLDHTAPNAPSTPDLNGGSDSGASNSDDITSSVTPVVTGTAEAGSTVTLYDTNGTTVLGTTTATGGNWSITTGTLAEGSHTLTAKATDAAGNVSNASSPLAVTIDTTAPASVALSATTLVTANAGTGATVGTLSANDATAVTYALASGSNDADNAKFVLSGNTLTIGGSALTAGTYHVNLSATDAAGNVSHIAQNITVQDAPSVTSIVRVGGADAGAATSVDYTVTFSDSVTGVDASDFALTASGTAAGHIAAVNGSGTTYTVTVDSLAGDGTLRLDLNASGTGIQNGGSIAIGGGYTSGATYTLDHTAPNAPSTPDLSGGSDSGTSNTDNITANAVPIITGTAEAGSTVTLYDTNGTTVLGTTTTTNGTWSIAASTLADGNHRLTAKATDAAGNVSNASAPLTIAIDTVAAAPGAIALAAASDSGVAGDGITSVNAPAIAGTAEANATVTLYDTDGTTQLGTTTADGAGAWQIVSAALADGVHTLTARQVDRAGNASAASAGLTVTVDTQAPAAPEAPAVGAASDTGTVGDGITTVTRPVIRGTGAANAIVALYDTDGSTVLGTATVDGAGNWSVTSAALAVGTHALTAKQVDAAGNVSAAGAALALTIAAPPPPPPASSTIDGVAVSAQPVVLPGGGSGTQTVVPIVTPSRVESTGAAAVADIPLVQSGGANLLLAQVPVGFGLSATGGASRPAGDPLEHLIQAIVAATPGHAPADQAHLTGNGQQFLQALAADAPLLVQTVAPVSTGTAPAGQLVLTGTSDGAQHTALVIDATGLAAGSRIALNGVDFAAVVGAANVTGHSAGQILTGDAAAQTFTVAGNLGGAVFAGGGGDRLAFAATPATPASADGGVRADAGPVNTILHGGLGTDTAVFDGARSAYTFEQHEGYLVVTPTGQPAQHAVVVNVESLQFADATEAVVNRAGLSSIAGLYEAILGRQADYLGMDFWGGADRNGVGLGEIALRMIASQEAQGRLSGAFDGNASHDVALLYQDLFGRAGEAAGLAFWTDAMAHGMTLAQVAQSFATSAEFEQHKVGVAQWDFFV